MIRTRNYSGSAAAFLASAIIIFLAGAANTANAQPANPSFDCAKANTRDEVTICGDDRLAELDQAVTIALRQISGDQRKAALSVARDTVKARRSCGSEKLCIIDQQVSAIQTLSELGSQVPVPPWVGSYRLSLFRDLAEARTEGLPQAVAKCSITKIASISTRFGEELKPPTNELDSSGSAVFYANKGYQVSYSFIETIAASRIGDDVLLCLVSVPKNCPPGDDRGKVYSATNLRTKGVWVLPDAQHMCGGA